MKVNGTTIPSYLIVPAFVFTFWLGGLSISVTSLADDQTTHEEQPAHTTTVQDVATIKANVAHNKAAIDDVKKEQAAQRIQAAKDKKEILTAIRNQ